MTDRTIGERLPLSYAQEQLWFLDQLTPGETFYNVDIGYRLRGPLDVEVLQRSLTLLVARHETLRATFHDADGTPYQLISPPAEVELTVIDRTGEDRDEAVSRELGALAAIPFDLVTGPLYRFTLVRLADDDHVLALSFNHIVIDGWSVAIVNRELAVVYRDLMAGAEPDLPEPALRYRDFVAMQRDRVSVAELDSQLGFWAERLAGLTELDLPADQPRPATGSRAGGDLVLDYPPAFHQELRSFAEQQGTSLFILVTAAIGVVLGRYTRQLDVPLGVPMLGRTDPDLEDVVGMFVNMVVLRADLSGDPSFAGLLEQLAESSLDLYDHQDVPFEKVVERLDPVRVPGRNPLFQVSVQVLGASNSPAGFTLPGLTVEWLEPATTRASFDMNINFFETADGMRGHLSYPADMFGQWRIEAFLGHVEQVLRSAMKNPAQPVSRICLLTEAEHDRALAAGHQVEGIELCYVVDPAGNLLPRGVPGELLVNADEKTRQEQSAEHFEPNPFKQNSVVFRSGNVAHWTEDWQLEILDNDAPGQPAKPDTDGAVTTPATPTEATVASILQTVLDKPVEDPDANFFELGGNSLHATRVVSRINKTFGIKVSVRLLYGDSTVRAIAGAVDELTAAKS
ncbi:non-ribosomal peptide synthetase component F/acyl carrier protein [Kibdelosporangium banguiense]|uniref:Non-ribosomal peptide synthetase component F/acyl carrier protein n=1 Tax=Kibdelosporangium banguiense TaxID=1365924 RepID=A0ABS4TZ86_9PSEU|nr:condensation domain-containing protein [Kibdelosporangium banguiense]MBP2329725.1 non-ribosomal peptide synthetase component F/acyl carrier protein [Kibdelosporangium banguiense]